MLSFVEKFRVARQQSVYIYELTSERKSELHTRACALTRNWIVTFWFIG